MTANQSVLTSKKQKEQSRKVNMNELKVVFNRVSIYDPLISLGPLKTVLLACGDASK
jgi:hypothetical protein